MRRAHRRRPHAGLGQGGPAGDRAVPATWWLADRQTASRNQDRLAAIATDDRRAPRRGALPRSDGAQLPRPRRPPAPVPVDADGSLPTRRSCAAAVRGAGRARGGPAGGRSSACAARSTSCGEDVADAGAGRSTRSRTRHSTCAGSSTRRVTECYAVQTLARTAQRLGADARAGARAGGAALGDEHPPRSPMQYGVPPGCADGERLDLRTADPAGPSEPLAPPGDGVRERALERDLGLPAGRRPQPPRVAAHLHHLVRAHERRVDAVVEPRAGGRRQQLQQLARRRRAARADVEDRPGSARSASSR